jgi:hypothetical protein
MAKGKSQPVQKSIQFIVLGLELAIKGTVARDFPPPFFPSKVSTLDPDTYPKFFRICFQNCEVIRIKIWLPAASCKNDAAGSQISPLHFAAGSQISPLHCAAGNQISPLHFAAGNQILPLHDAAWSKILQLHDSAGSQV